MNRFYLPKAFKVPADYYIPPNEELATDTQHPELNFKDYKHQVSQYKSPNEFHPQYTEIHQNKEGLFLLGTNEYTKYFLTGVLGGTYDFDDIVESNFKKAKFTAVLRENILGLYFLDNITFLAAVPSNSIELYSTKAPKVLQQENHRDNFCFLKSCSQTSDGQINCLCSTKPNRFIVGTSRGHFEFYEYDSKNLHQIFSLPYGHCDEITGISAHPSIDVSWISTSDDMSCKLWDKRQVYPATIVIGKHDERLTDVHFYDVDTIILSDSAGDIFSFDLRNTKEPVCKDHVIDRTINSLHVNENKIGIVTESCKAFIYKFDDKKEFKLLDEHNSQTHIINSLCWNNYDKKDTYYVVGERKYAKEVTLNTQE